MISSVGGLKIPPVDAFIAGYQFCAKKVKPSITTLNGYSQDFVAQDKCKEVALQQMGEDSDVVFQVAGGCGLGAIQGAKEQKKWGIGVDTDQGFLGNHVLTSATKKVDVGVFETIQLAKHEGVEGRRRHRLQREEQGCRLRQGLQDRAEPRRADRQASTCGRGTSRAARSSRRAPSPASSAAKSKRQRAGLTGPPAAFPDGPEPRGSGGRGPASLAADRARRSSLTLRRRRLRRRRRVAGGGGERRRFVSRS